MFDANAFMSQPAEPLSTKYEVTPEGDFKMMIDTEYKVNNIKFNKDGEDREFQQLELNCVVLDEAIKAKLGRDKVTVRMRIPLDFDEGGKLSTGPNKNVRLGQLRDVLGQNNPGWVPTQLLGAGPFMGKVTHSSDKKDPSIKYADVTRVAKIS